MLPENQITQLAHSLFRARRDCKPLAQFSKALCGLSIDAAYAIQREWTRQETRAGRELRGYKVGLTSQALQLAFQTGEPDYGPLLDDMLFESGSEIPVERFIAPRIEVELAFVLGRPLQGPGVTVDEVLRATDHVTPAFELIDARIEQFDRETRQPRKLADVIADFAAAAGVVLGTQRIAPRPFDFRRTEATAYKNEVAEVTGTGAAVLGDPTLSVVWLANKLATAGCALKAGDILLAGSFTKPVTAARGDVMRADYGRLGEISFKFV